MSLSASLAAIESRIAELVKAAEQVAAQHNFFMGSITELRNLAATMKKDVPAAASLVSDVETAAPLVEDAVPAVEAVVEAASAL